MGFTRVHIKSDKRSAVLNADGKNQYSQEWVVETDDVAIGPIEAAQAPGLPQMRDFYIHGTEFDLSSRVTRISPRNAAGFPNIYEIQYDYDFIDPIENPLDRPVKWSMSFAAFGRIAVKDIEDNPVENSAGMAYNPPIEIDDSRPIVRAVRNEPDFFVPRARAFKDAINSQDWKTIPPFTAKIKDMASGDQQEENGIKFYAVTYEFELHEKDGGWLYEILDAGFYEKVDEFPPFKSILDGEGNPVQEPVKLDGNGKILRPGDDPVYKEWHLLKELDFNELAL